LNHTIDDDGDGLGNLEDVRPKDLPLLAAVNQPKKFAQLAKNFSTNRLRRLLSSACEACAVELGIRLIEVLDNVNYSTDDAGCPLLSAAGNGSLALTQALRAAGAKKDLGHALMMAAENGHLEVVRDLLPEAITETFLRKGDWNLASEAAKAGHLEIAELLLPYAMGSQSAVAKTQIKKLRERQKRPRRKK